MGLFDSLFKSGLKAVGNAVADVVVDAVADALKGDSTNAKSTVGAATTSASKVELDNRSFDQKLQAILPNVGNYEVRRNVSPDELEQEAGMKIYTRGGCYAKPDELSYVLYKDGQRVLVINLWWVYQDYNHYANREIRKYCKNNGIKVLDFFDYLPNEADYMEDRIRKALAE